MSRVCVLGTGARVAGWAARFVVMGWDVAVPRAALDDAFTATLERARTALPGLYDRAPPPEGKILAVDDIADGVAGADLALIAGAETPDLARIAGAASANVPILRDSDTGLEAGSGDPGVVTLRAFDPVFLWPGFEIAAASNAPLDRARAALAAVGMAEGNERPPIGTTDAAIVGVLRALRHADSGLGRALRAHEATWPLAQTDWTRPIVAADRVVPLDWTDFNGHMTESRYLLAFADATERVMELLGCTEDYIAAGGSFFTAETHIRHVSEILAGQRFTITSQAILANGAKLHMFQSMWHGDALIATGEHFLLHVDLGTRRPAPPSGAVAEGIARLARGHADLPRPDGAGRAVGQRP